MIFNGLIRSIEIRPLIRWFFSGINVFYFFKHLAWVLRFRLRIKFSSNNIAHYPSSVQLKYLVASQALRQKKVKGIDGKRASITLPNKFFSKPVTVSLAVSEACFISSDITNLDFFDYEDEESLHRMGWLLRPSSSFNDGIVPLIVGQNLIRIWIKKYSGDSSSTVNDAYTISERICNIIVYYKFHTSSWKSLPSDIQDYLSLCVTNLLDKLEYKLPELTGNHPVNNARALLFFSLVTGLDPIEKLAKSILQERLKSIQDDDGYLKDGSTHYQFLFTRWLAELKAVSCELQNPDSFDFLEQPLRLAMKALDSFCVGEHPVKSAIFPLIGDVSPDFAPVWFVDFFSEFATQDGNDSRMGLTPITWRKIYDKAFNFDLSSYFHNRMPRKKKLICESKISGWVRIEFNGWTVFYRSPRTEMRLASHAHVDAMSVCIFDGNREIVIDPGRVSYSSDTNQKNCLELGVFHNMPIIDNLCCVIGERDYLHPNEYKKVDYSQEYVEGAECLEIKIRHNGFSRVSANHIRILRLGIEDIKIIDSIQMKHKKNVSFSYITPLEVEVDRISFTVETSSKSIENTFVKNVVGLYQCVTYGKTTKANLWKYSGVGGKNIYSEFVYRRVI